MVRKTQPLAAVNDPDFNTEEPPGNRCRFYFEDSETLFSAVRSLPSSKKKPSYRPPALPAPAKSAPLQPRRSSRGDSSASVPLNTSDPELSDTTGSSSSALSSADRTSKRARYTLGRELMTRGNFSEYDTISPKNNPPRTLKAGQFVLLNSQHAIQIAAVGTITKLPETVFAVVILLKGSGKNTMFAPAPALQMQLARKPAKKITKEQRKRLEVWITTRPNQRKGQGELSKPRSIRSDSI